MQFKSKHPNCAVLKHHGPVLANVSLQPRPAIRNMLWRSGQQPCISQWVCVKTLQTEQLCILCLWEITEML